MSMITLCNYIGLNIIIFPIEIIDMLYKKYFSFVKHIYSYNILSYKLFFNFVFVKTYLYPFCRI